MAAAFAAFVRDLPERPEASRVLHKLASDGQRKTAAAMGAALADGTSRPLSEGPDRSAPRRDLGMSGAQPDRIVDLSPAR